MVCFYTSVVRPILELRLLSLTLKPHCGSGGRPRVNLKEREMRLLCQADDKIACIIVGIEDLLSRRARSTLSFFNRNVLNTESDLHYLLPLIIDRYLDNEE